ncbi:MAG: hypothetical protein NVS3B21_32580 [Acidimicrobiales bacterium]
MIRTQGLTHLHLIVGDIERSRRFYTELFGAEEKFRISPELIFFQTPGSRDLIALHGGADSTGIAGNSAGIAHFGFRLLPDVDLDDALPAVEEAGGVVKERGVHPHGLQFAMVGDPDGYVIELLGPDPRVS